MSTALYIIWFLLPIFFFTLSLWSKLERIGGKVQGENAQDFFSQGVFVLICVLISVGLDTYVLEDLANAVSPEWLPLGFFQVMVLPLVLYIGAKIVGPTRSIKITKAPHPSRRIRK